MYEGYLTNSLSFHCNNNLSSDGKISEKVKTSEAFPVKKIYSKFLENPQIIKKSNKLESTPKNLNKTQKMKNNMKKTLKFKTN